MIDALKILGMASLFLGGSTVFHAFMWQQNAKYFAFQFIVGPALIYLGSKLLL